MRLNLLTFLPAFIILVTVSAGCGVTANNADGITAICPEARQYLPGYPPFSDKEGFFNDPLLSTPEFVRLMNLARRELDKTRVTKNV